MNPSSIIHELSFHEFAHYVYGVLTQLCRIHVWSPASVLVHQMCCLSLLIVFMPSNTHLEHKSEQKLIQVKFILSKLRSLLLIVKEKSWSTAGVSSLATVSLQLLDFSLILFEEWAYYIYKVCKLLREEFFLNLNLNCI